MARPRLAIPFEDVLDAYERTGSIRGTAKMLTCSRWAVQRRLEEYGVNPLDRDAALAQVRLLRASNPARTRVEERTKMRGTGVIGCTVITFKRRVAFSPCVWPGCENEVEVGAVCAEHATVSSAGWDCAWPGCTQSVMSGATCYEHQKVRDGLIEHRA